MSRDPRRCELRFRHGGWIKTCRALCVNLSDVTIERVKRNARHPVVVLQILYDTPRQVISIFFLYLFFNKLAHPLFTKILNCSFDVENEGIIQELRVKGETDYTLDILNIINLN